MAYFLQISTSVLATIPADLHIYMDLYAVRIYPLIHGCPAEIRNLLKAISVYSEMLSFKPRNSSPAK